MPKQPITLFKETQLGELGSEDADGRLVLKLPLPAVDIPEKVLFSASETTDTADPENHYYLEHVATDGGFLTRSQQDRNTSFNTIAWRVVEKTRVVDLMVCDLTVTESQFRSIRVISPMKIDTNCLTITDTAENMLVLDFITESGFLYTVTFDFEYFLRSCTLDDLNNRNASIWRSIKVPRGFDVSKSICMTAVSSYLLTLSLSNGDLISISRDSALDAIQCDHFSQPRSFGSSFSKWLSKSDGYPNMSNDSVISMAVSPDKLYLFTLALNRTMKIWSLSTLGVVSESVLGSSESNILLSPQPTAAFAFASSKDGSQTYLATNLPLADSCFKLWIYDPNDPSLLVDLGRSYEIDSVAPDSVSVWTVSDFSLLIKSHHLELWVVWKSDTSMSIRTHIISTKNDGHTQKSHPWIATDQSETSSTDYVSFADFNSQSESEYFIRKIFGPSGYSKKTIATALPIYSSQYVQDEIDDNLESDNLVDAVCKRVGSAVSVGTQWSENIIDNQSGLSETRDDAAMFERYRRSLELQWTRFDRLCLELERQGQDFLAMTYDSETNSIFVLKASFLSFVRQCTNIELFFYNRSAAPSKSVRENLAKATGRDSAVVEKILKLVYSLYEFKQSLTHQVRYGLFLELAEDFSSSKHRYLTADRMMHMHHNNLSHLGDLELSFLSSSLTEIGDPDGLVQLIAEELSSEVTPVKSNQQKLSYAGSSTLFNVLYQHCAISKLIVFDILATCLISSVREGFFNEYISHFTKFSGILKTISGTIDAQNDVFIKQTSLSNAGDLETQSNADLDVARGFFIEQLTSGRSVNSSGLSLRGIKSTLSELWREISKPTGLGQLAVTMYLLGYTRESVAFANFYLGQDYFSSLVRAHLLLLAGEAQKGLALLERCSIGLSTGAYEKEPFDVSIISKICSMYEERAVLGKGLVVFYMSHAQLCGSLNYHPEALRLASLAAQNLDGQAEETTTVYEQVFEAALKSQDFEQAYNAITEIFYSDGDKDRLSDLIGQLATHMTNNGMGSRFCQYPFIGMERMVEEFLELVVQNKQGKYTLEELTPFYHLQYSWKFEHGDVRGAASALYDRLQKTKLTLDGSSRETKADILRDIEELYRTVLNALKCISENDTKEMWMVARQESGKRFLLFYNDIEKEHRNFMSDVETALRAIV